MKTGIRSIGEILKKEMYMNKKSILAVMLVTCFVFGVMAVSAYGLRLAPGKMGFGKGKAARAKTIINVNVDGTGDYTTIAAAINAANPGDTIMVGPGDYAGAIISKEVEIIGSDGARITTSNIMMPYDNLYFLTTVGFYIPPGHNADGAKVSNFTIDGIQVAVQGNGANNITVSHLKIKNCMMGIANAGGSGWTIIHNKITDFATTPTQFRLGIGLKGLRKGFPGISIAENNLIAFNEIYSDTQIPGLVIGLIIASPRLTADYIPVRNNKIVHNKVQISGSTTITAGLIVQGVINSGNVSGNYVGFNDLRGTFVDATPPAPYGVELVLQSVSPEANEISRNFGDLWYTVSPPIFTFVRTGENRSFDGLPADLFNPQQPE